MIEEDQPMLLSTILDIVEGLSAADDRRRSQITRSVMTLDDLLEELESRGFNLSRNALCCRLEPRLR